MQIINIFWHKKGHNMPINNRPLQKHSSRVLVLIRDRMVTNCLILFFDTHTDYNRKNG